MAELNAGGISGFVLSGPALQRLNAMRARNPGEVYSYGGRDYPSFEAAKRANPDMPLISPSPSAAEARRGYEMERGRAFASSIGEGPLALGTMSYLRGGGPDDIRRSTQFDQALGGLAADISLLPPAARSARGSIGGGAPLAPWTRAAPDRSASPPLASVLRNDGQGVAGEAAASPILRSPAHRRMAEMLRNRDFRDFGFGTLSKDKFDRINEKLTAQGQEPLRDRDINVPANVLRKLYQKRVQEGGLSPERVSDTAYSALHSSKSQPLLTRQPDIIALVNARDPTSNLGFVARHSRDGSTIVKSAYPVDTKKLRKKLR